jgi:hypothetical protein
MQLFYFGSRRHHKYYLNIAKNKPEMWKFILNDQREIEKQKERPWQKVRCVAQTPFLAAVTAAQVTRRQAKSQESY